MIDIILKLEVNQIEVSSHSLIQCFTSWRKWVRACSSWIFNQYSSGVKFTTRLALSSTEDIEELFKLIVKENVSELVEMHIFVPLRHEFCSISITLIQL